MPRGSTASIFQVILNSPDSGYRTLSVKINGDVICANVSPEQLNIYQHGCYTKKPEIPTFDNNKLMNVY